jgi:hypothetical protein
LAAGLLALQASRWDWGASRLAAFCTAAAFALLAAAGAFTWPRLAATVAWSAVLIGTAAILRSGLMSFWLIPCLLIGFGAAVLSGARYPRSPETTAIILTVVAASTLAFLVTPMAVGAALAEADGALPIQTPYWIEVQAVLAFGAAVLMGRWRWAGGALAFASLVPALAAIAAEGMSAAGWAIWAGPSTLLVVAGAIALGQPRPNNGIQTDNPAGCR